MFNFNKISAAIATTIIATTMTTNVMASDYSAEPIYMPLDVNKGEGADLVAKAFIEVFEKHYKQKVNVEYAGANARVLVMNADPDGFTFMISNLSSVFSNPKETSKFLELYNVNNILASGYNAFIVHSDSASKDWKSFESESQSREMNIVTNGKSSSGYLLAQNIKDTTKAKFSIIPYGNSSTGSNDVASKKMDGAFLSSPLILDNVNSGSVTPLFVTSPTRLKDFPNTPTSKELGINGMKEINFGIITPRNLTPDAKKNLDDAVQKVVKDTDFINKIEKLGFKVNLQNSEEATAKVKSDGEFYSNLEK